MRVDSNFFCTVPMDDAGRVEPTRRRYGNDAVIKCYRNLVSWAKTADSLGYDTMWLTEHHFQFEGYEVLPNLIQFGQHLDQRHFELAKEFVKSVVLQPSAERLGDAQRDIRVLGRIPRDQRHGNFVHSLLFLARADQIADFGHADIEFLPGDRLMLRPVESKNELIWERIK